MKKDNGGDAKRRTIPNTRQGRTGEPGKERVDADAGGAVDAETTGSGI